MTLAEEDVSVAEDKMPGHKSRSWIFELSVLAHDPNDPADSERVEEIARAFTLPEPPAELAVQFGRGQLNEPMWNTLVFLGYLETKDQVYQSRLQSWLPEAKFESTTIARRDDSLRQCTRLSDRYVLSPDPPGSSSSSVAASEVESAVSTSAVSTKSKISYDGFVMWTLGNAERVKAGGKSWSVAGSDKPESNGKTDVIVNLLREHGERTGNPRAGIEAVAKQFPQAFMYAHAGIEKLAQILVPKIRDTEFTPRPWQEALIDIIKGDPHSRQILWIADPVGGSGKSVLTNHLCCEYDGILLSDSKEGDMAFAYKGESLVIFDVARLTSMDACKACFEIAEKFKNGRLFSPKYSSSTKQFKVPHVLFLSNQSPPPGVWTEDRIADTVFELSLPSTFRAASGGSTTAAARIAGESDEILEAAIDKMRKVAIEYHARKEARLEKEAPRQPSTSPTGEKRGREETYEEEAF